MSEPILIVEDDFGVRSTIVNFLELEGYTVDAVSNTRDAMDRLATRPYPLVISDIYVDDRTGLDVLMKAKEHDANCPVILMTARGTMETVMTATRNGAFDYLAKPFELDTLLESVKRALEIRNSGDDEVEHEELPESEMIGISSVMVEIYKTVSKVAPTTASFLIEGETGTGKEMVARMIHRFKRIACRRSRLFRWIAARFHSGRVARKRTLRPHARRVHGRRSRPHRCHRSGQPPLPQVRFSSMKSRRHHFDSAFQVEVTALPAGGAGNPSP